MSYAQWHDVERLVRPSLSATAWTDWQTKLLAAGSTPDQFWEDLLAPATDASIDSFCRRTFKTVTESRNYEGNDLPRIRLGVWPVQSVTQVSLHILSNQVLYTFLADNIAHIRKVDSRGNVISTASDGANISLQVQCAEGILGILPVAFGLSTWEYSPVFPYYTFVSAGGWWYNCVVDLTYGYTEETIPQDLRLAAAATGGAMLLVAIADAETVGMVSWTVGPETRRWGSGGVGPPDPLAGFLMVGPHAPLYNSLCARASATLKRHRVITVS